MNINKGELKKLFSFREIYIGFLICIGVLALYFYSVYSEVNYGNFYFWKSIHQFIPQIGYWFIAIMLVVGLSKLFPYEREIGFMDLIKTYKNGRTKFVYYKILIVFLYSFLVVTLFYIFAVIYYGSVYTIGDINRLMSQVNYTNLWSDYLVNIGRFTQWQYLLYEYVYLIFAGFSFGLFIVLVSLLIQNSSWVMVICGGLFAVLEFFDRYIALMDLGDLFAYAVMWPAHYVYKYGYNGMLSFQYLHQVDLPQIWKLIVYVFGSIAINIFLIIIIYGRKPKC